MSKRADLTDAEIERIVEMRERRVPVVIIARRIGCSHGSVCWALLRLGVDIHADKPLPDVPREPVVQKRGDHIVRRFTEAEDARLLALEAQGMSYNRIGVELGRRHNSIIGRLRTLARREARLEACA